ncbi:MAG: hypothetical protein IT200_06800 [Thermoleophilia bacterium]|nr:hypothetical protein [Thermoleophilia bacterium]
MRRDEAIGRLLSRALTRPTNLLPGAAVAAAGIAVGFWPLVLAGVVVYGVLAATTLLSKDEARRALGRPPRAGVPAAREDRTPAELRDPGVRQRYEEAHAEYGRIQAALATSPVPLPEVEVETAGLMDDVGGLCRRAQAVCDYLESVDEGALAADRERAARELRTAGPDVAPALTETVGALDQQIATVQDMYGKLRAFDARMRQLISALGAIRGEIARLQVESHPDDSARVLEHVGSAREMVSGLTRTFGSGDGGEGRRAQAG